RNELEQEYLHEQHLHRDVHQPGDTGWTGLSLAGRSRPVAGGTEHTARAGGRDMGNRPGSNSKPGSLLFPRLPGLLLVLHAVVCYLLAAVGSRKLQIED